MVKLKGKFVFLLLILSIILFYIFFCFYRIKVTQTRFLLGTQITITVLVKDQNDGLRKIDQAFREIERLEKIYSDRRADSELVRLNQLAKQDWVHVSDEMADILNNAFYWYEKTDGLFDITIGSLGKLWGFKTNDQGHVPDPKRVRELVDKIGMEKLYWDEGKQRIKFANPVIQLDLGGIAKLAILRKLDDYFKQQNFYQYLVNLGGDVLAGQRGPIKKWQVGIADPKDPENIIACLEVEDSLVLTSGDYFRKFSEGGKNYHHIIDPRTGYPRNTLNAVTVVMPSIQPDPIPSLVIFLLGKKAGLAMLENMPTVEGLMLQDDELIYSSGFQKYQIK